MPIEMILLQKQESELDELFDALYVGELIDDVDGNLDILNK